LQESNQDEERKNEKSTQLDGVLQESNQEEEMKRLNNGVQGVSNRGCWKTRQYNVQCQERNQEEERKNTKPTQLDGVLQESNQGCVNIQNRTYIVQGLLND